MKLSIVEKKHKLFYRFRYYGIIAAIFLFSIVNYESNMNKADFKVGFFVAGSLFISLYFLGYFLKSLFRTYRIIGVLKLNEDSIELNLTDNESKVIRDITSVDIDLNFIEGTKFMYVKGRPSKYQNDSSRKFNEGVFNYITIDSSELNYEFEFHLPSKEVYQNILNFKNENLKYNLIFRYFGKKVINPEKEYDRDFLSKKLYQKKYEN